MFENCGFILDWALPDSIELYGGKTRVKGMRAGSERIKWNRKM